MNDSQVKHIVIVGGGSAGWITAGRLAAQYKSDSPGGIRISLIESPDVATIGVGEGTWPSMRNTLQKIGIKESDFIINCYASFKQGSKFVGWKNGLTSDYYYHPFVSPPGYESSNLHGGWLSLNQAASFADTVSVQSHVCNAGCAPKQIATPEYAGVTNYGYHLDAAKFANMLQQHCTQVLGVAHIRDHVSAVVSADNGDISAIKTQSSGEIAGDFFIDCSGSHSLLLGQHYKIPFINKSHILFNDSALAVQVPYAQEDSPIASATISTAQQAGWIWDIALSNRRGVGYTYASSHSSDDQAAQALQAYLQLSVGKVAAEKLSFRKLAFTPGHREKFWLNNCVAIGMSAGFLEPLEASALALVELSCNMLCDELPRDREHMAILAKRYNQRFSYRWDRVVEFLKLHYVLSERGAEAYWHDNQHSQSIPENLQELLRLWRYQPPSRHDFVQNEEVFSSSSYQYVLYGMAYNTGLRDNTLTLAEADMVRRYFAENQQKKNQYIAGLPTNRELITHIKKNSVATQ